MKNKIKLALLSGGISGEREVSLNTGKEIYKALDKERYEVIKYDPKTDLNKFIKDVLARKIDLVFPALHGPFGEDGKLQGMLDALEVPYVFSGCLASALAMNKYKTKIIAEDAGLKVASHVLLRRGEEFKTEELVEKLLLPIVIKPTELGSSVGISIARTDEEIEEGIKRAFDYDKEILLEKFISGRELTATVLETDFKREVLPITEIIPRVANFYDYESKYADGGSKHVCPAKIPSKTKNEIKKFTLDVFEAMGCKDLARADFIWDEKEDKVYFLEINTIPGMTTTSLAPESAKKAGIDFSNLLNILIKNNLTNN